MVKRIQLFLFFVTLCSAVPDVTHAQAWSGILDPSRATDWSTAGFTIPNYSTPCATQPSLLTGIGNAAANSTSIQASIASCDATHNVVNLPLGTYYVTGIYSGGKNNFVLRGAGPNSTYIYMTGRASTCGTEGGNGCDIAIEPTSARYVQGSYFQPGNNGVCSLTGVSATSTVTAGTYTKGGTYIGLSSCGAGTTAPPVGQLMTLDQADDTTDNGGIWSCSTFDSSFACTQHGIGNPVNATGRVIGGVQYSMEQQVVVKSIVSGSGTGPYVIQIQDPFIHNNYRSSQTPGAFWSEYGTLYTKNVGIESLTLDYSSSSGALAGISIDWCVGCWIRNVRSFQGAGTNHVFLESSAHVVVRDSYFFGKYHGGSSSYTIQLANISSSLIENNIFQQTTGGFVGDGVTGNVFGYNCTPDVNPGSSFLQGMYFSHNSGSAFNLLEGNSTTNMMADDIWGTNFLGTSFRNHATGWEKGYTQQTIPVYINSFDRAFNIIGNVLGQPSFHTHYESYATSAAGGVNGGAAASLSVFEIGWGDGGGLGTCANPGCDPIVRSTLMRWGNYDTVNAAVRWDATESSPGAVAYVNAQTTPASQTLPNSFYLNGRPGWFRSVSFPAYGPEVTSGTTGICTGGTYAGAEATSSSQCTGGTLTPSAWGGHANVNPAQDCYLNIMNGPPDGSGSVLAFDANSCYYGKSGSLPDAPNNLAAVVN